MDDKNINNTQNNTPNTDVGLDVNDENTFQTSSSTSQQYSSVNQLKNENVHDDNSSNTKSYPSATTPYSADPIPPQQNTENGKNQPTSLVTTDKKKKGVVDILIFLAIIISFFIWSGVAYLYIQNKNVNKTITDNITPLATQTPLPTVPPLNLSIIGGNVVNTIGGEQIILVNKDDHKETGIIGFISVIESPDKNKMCFESLPPSPQPALYLSDVDGTNVIEVSKNKHNCLWSENQSKIAYNNLTSSKNKNSDIYVYDLLSQEEINITQELMSTDSAELMNYKALSWSDNDTKLICEYYISDDVENIQNCELDLTKLNPNDI